MLAGIWLLEGLAVRAIGAARERVVDRLQCAAVVGCAADVAGPHLRIGDREERRQRVLAVVALERSEEEDLVLLNRTAKRPAEVVLLQRLLVRLCRRAEVVRSRIQPIA